VGLSGGDCRETSLIKASPCFGVNFTEMRAAMAAFERFSSGFVDES